MFDHLPRLSLSWPQLPSLSLPIQRRPGRPWLWLAVAAGAGAILGAGAMWFFEPRLGRHRRSELAQRATKSVEHALHDGRGSLAHSSAVVRGNIAGFHPFGRGRIAIDDATLADKVRSELFADPAVPKSDIVINAERGRVVLRGEVEPDKIELVERKARRIPGVDGVDNLLRARATSIAIE